MAAVRRGLRAVGVRAHSRHQFCWALAPEATTITPLLKLVRERFFQSCIKLESSSLHILCVLRHVLYGADRNVPRPHLK